MEIDVAGVLHRLRQLEREHGARSAAPSARPRTSPPTHLRKRPRIDNMQFGVAMVARGHVPKDKVGAAEMGMKLAKQMLPLAARRRPAGGQARAGRRRSTLPFYAGCALPQDHELHALVHEVAAGFGVRLDEAADAGCCGHPSRGAVDSLFAADGARLHGVPGLRREPRGERRRRPSRCGTRSPSAPAAARHRAAGGGDALRPLRRLPRRPRRRARRPRRRRRAGRRRHGGRLPDAAQRLLRRPGRHVPRRHQGQRPAPGVRRGAGARPVVTTCVLCRDNLRSAARELKLDVPVHFWPEFFRAGPNAPEERTDD